MQRPRSHPSLEAVLLPGEAELVPVPLLAGMMRCHQGCPWLLSPPLTSRASPHGLHLRNRRIDKQPLIHRMGLQIPAAYFYSSNTASGDKYPPFRDIPEKVAPTGRKVASQDGPPGAEINLLHSAARRAALPLRTQKPFSRSGRAIRVTSCACGMGLAALGFASLSQGQVFFSTEGVNTFCLSCNVPKRTY